MTTEVHVRLEGSSGVAHDYTQTELRRCKRCPNLFPPNGQYYWVREYCLVQFISYFHLVVPVVERLRQECVRGRGVVSRLHQNADEVVV